MEHSPGDVFSSKQSELFERARLIANIAAPFATVSVEFELRPETKPHFQFARENIEVQDE